MHPVSDEPTSQNDIPDHHATFDPQIVQISDEKGSAKKTSYLSSNDSLILAKSSSISKQPAVNTTQKKQRESKQENALK